jgi:excisionase family DNA binding protein
MSGYTIQEIADMIGTSAYVVRNQINVGKLRAYKFSGNCVRILPKDLEAWLENAMVRPSKNKEEIAA